MKISPWDGIACDWQEAPDDGALANAARLVSAARDAGMPPESAATGNWLSARLFWDGGRTEVEIFKDRFELYFLPGSSEDRDFQIEHISADDPGALTLLIGKIREARASLHK